MQFFLLVLLAALAVAFANDGIVEIDPEKFSEQVVGDDKVWLVEFFSSMCGSCQEFSPTWKKIVHKAKTVMKGEVNIDTPKGMALAQKLGALDEGIPNVRMFSRMGDPKGKSIVNGKMPVLS